jgi:alkaline phosphatase
MGEKIYDPIVEKADNFIIMIGDGMGVNNTLLFDVLENNVAYSDGEDTFYVYYLPYSGFSKTKSTAMITDSAAGGTALACGIKTKNGHVGQDKDHQEVESITELAGFMGMSTAVMSTEVQTGATPAAFSAHADGRDMSDMIKKSQKELQSAYGTIIDCGYDTYTTSGVLSIENKVRSNLKTMGQNENGFFMMYEEAYTDKHNHDNNMDMSFKALVRFNQVIATVMEYAFYNPNTFVIITADHETGGLTMKNGTYIYTSTDHTSKDVPVFAYGYRAELFGGKTIENVQIPQTIASFMGVDDFGDQTQYKALTK